MIATIAIIVIIGIVLIFALGLHKKFFKDHKLEDAIFHYNKQNYLAARSALEELSIKDSKAGSLVWLMGNCSLQLGETARAISEFRKALQLNNFSKPADFEEVFRDFDEINVHRLLRDIFKKGGDDESLFQQNQILMRLEPDKPEHPFAIAENLLRKKEYSERTIKFLQKVIDIDSENTDAYIWLAVVYFKQEDFNKAAGFSSRALDINATLVDAKYIKGELAIKNGHVDEAIESLEVATQSPNFQKSAAYRLAHIYFEKEEMGEAEGWAQKADTAPLSAHEDPELEWLCKYYSGLIYQHLGRNSSAKELFERILEHKPNYKDVADRIKELGEGTDSEFVKDFVTAKTDVFVNTSEKIVEAMGYTVMRSDLTSDGGVTMRAKDRQSPPTTYGVFVRRNYDLVNEDQLRKLKTFVESANCDIGIFINTGDFTNTAKDFAFKAKIKLVNAEKLEPLLAKIVKTEV